MSAPFHMTRMGQRFYEHTMPELVRQLSRLNDLLEGTPGHAPAPPAPGRYVITGVARPDGEDDWFVIDRHDEEPAVLAGQGTEGRRRARELARAFERKQGATE